MTNTRSFVTFLPFRNFGWNNERLCRSILSCFYSPRPKSACQDDRKCVCKWNKYSRFNLLKLSNFQDKAFHFTRCFVIKYYHKLDNTVATAICIQRTINRPSLLRISILRGLFQFTSPWIRIKAIRPLRLLCEFCRLWRFIEFPSLQTHSRPLWETISLKLV